jgi:hypothetical protein
MKQAVPKVVVAGAHGLLPLVAARPVAASSESRKAEGSNAVIGQCIEFMLPITAVIHNFELSSSIF